MGILRSTHHAHTVYVKGGQSTAEEMVLAAIRAGFRSIGLSEHGTQAVDPIHGLTPADAPRYIAEVRALREKYKGQIRVHLGVEQDQLSSARREDYEYVIGSVHYRVRGGEVYAVDGSPDALRECRARHFGESGALLEVNTGGMARGFLDTPYPEPRLLRFWHDLGGRVIVGSDSHHARTIDYAFGQMPAYLRAAGFRSFWELGGEGEARFVERGLD